MKTIAQVTKNNSNYKSLIKAVIDNIGEDYIQDVVNYGIDGGYNGFIYNSDTHAFALAHQTKIVELLEEQAEQLGEDVVKMVSGFGVFRNSPMDADDKKDLYKYLSGVAPEQGVITNVMAWFAAEEVCRMFEA